MRLSRIALATVVVGLGLGFSSGQAQARAQAADPLTGTWELDVAKSKYSPGPAPKTLTLKIEDTAQGMKSTVDLVLPDGQVRHQEYTAKDDGKDYPLVGSAIADTVSLTSKGNTRTRTDKKGGKVVMTYVGTLSSDGKTFNVQQKGTDEKGQPVSNTVVFRKKA